MALGSRIVGSKLTAGVIGSAGAMRSDRVVAVAEMSVPLLATRQLPVEIGGMTVTSGLDRCLAADERLAILGRNGSGQSTRQATRAELCPASGGTIRVAELLTVGAKWKRPH